MTRRTELAVWAWAAFVTTLAALTTLWLSGQDVVLDVGGQWPFWVVAVLMFALQSLRINIATTGGRHVVVLSELVLAVGLFHVEPVALVLGGLLGAAPAFLQVRTAPMKFAVNFGHTALAQIDQQRAQRFQPKDKVRRQSLWHNIHHRTDQRRGGLGISHQRGQTTAPSDHRERHFGVRKWRPVSAMIKLTISCT